MQIWDCRNITFEYCTGCRVNILDIEFNSELSVCIGIAYFLHALVNYIEHKVSRFSRFKTYETAPDWEMSSGI